MPSGPEMKLLPYEVCVASVLVAIAARAMGGMLGAAVAPSGPHLQRSERRSGLTLVVIESPLGTRGFEVRFALGAGRADGRPRGRLKSGLDW